MQKTGALSSSIYSLLRATKDKPEEINLKRPEGRSRTCGPNDNIISLDFKETSVYESPNKDLLPPSFPKNLKKIKIPEDSKNGKNGTKVKKLGRNEEE